MGTGHKPCDRSRHIEYLIISPMKRLTKFKYGTLKLIVYLDRDKSNVTEQCSAVYRHGEGFQEKDLCIYYNNAKQRSKLDLVI